MNRLKLRQNHSSGEGRDALPPEQTTPRVRRHPGSAGLSPPSQKILPAARVQRGVSAPGHNRATTSASDPSSLPSAWTITELALQHTDPLTISMNASPKTTIYANIPIPRALLQQSAAARKSAWRRKSGSADGGSALYPNLADPPGAATSFGSPPMNMNPNASQVYYFEVAVLCPHPSSASASASSGDVDVAIGLFCGIDTFGAWPGELPNSIGWGSDGLHIDGCRFEATANTIHFRNGDVLGCGMEISGLQRVFFTRNGTMVVPPSPNTSFSGSRDLNCFPVASFRHGNVSGSGNGNLLKANFGLDPATPLRWTGTDRIAIVSQQTGGCSPSYNTTSMDSPPLFTLEGATPSMFRSTGGDPSNQGRAQLSSQSSSSSPYYSIQDLDRLDEPMSMSASAKMQGAPILSSPGAMLTRSASRQTPSTTLGSSSSTSSSTTHPQRGSFFGTQNNRNKSLVDDDPSGTNPTTSEHFNLTPPLSSNSSTPWPGDGEGEGGRESDLPQRTPSGGSESSTSKRRSARREERAARRARSGEEPLHNSLPGIPTNTSGTFDHSTISNLDSLPASSSTNYMPTTTTTRKDEDTFESLPSPRRHNYMLTTTTTRKDEDTFDNLAAPRSKSYISTTTRKDDDAFESLPGPRSNSYMTTTTRKDDDRKRQPRNRGDMHIKESNEPTGGTASRPGDVVVAAKYDVEKAKENAQALLLAAGKRGIDGKAVKEKLDACKKDQERLQLKLNNALEEADAIENLEELFSVNDRICSAIEAGNEALKREKSSSKKKKAIEGPTIDLLVENEDVFSLICMLRAPNEKRLAAALALMKFARESEVLRNEIRSSGGMHSFLTIFRTKGMSRELQVVASLAIAYVLPSFVASSQTSSAVGLKVVECLRFLVTSKPIAPQNVVITREELLKAASVGVNVLWINAIQPLLVLETAKNESKLSRPALRPSASMRFGRLRGRSGGGMFDQGQESIEIQELTELAVTLIAHIAKLADSGELRFDMGYNIVEQVCEVDAARPIAVREGLLRILVDWIRSKDVDKVRPAASALRYLISIQDKYMAGWIHSQVVNEGAVGEIVKLLNESVGHDVRVAVAQMLSALCVAPHTRAAVVDANCVSYLVALLYEHTAPASAEMVHYAGSALLQLAAGAMIRASALTGNSLAVVDSASPDKQESVVNEILEGWAHGSFVQIAIEHKGKLRSVSVEALRVLSEDTNQTRQTRLQLCSAGAAEALGKTLKDDLSEIRPLKNPELFEASFHDPDSSLYTSVKDVHESLRGLANILEPQKEVTAKTQHDLLMSQVHVLNPQEMLIKGCLDIVKSGGLDSLIWISSLPYTQSPLSESGRTISADRADLLDEACRLLANLSPLLLSDVAAANGCAKWTSEVFEALDGILNRLEEKVDENITDTSTELNIDALRGLGALARYEPLKIRIVDKSLPKLLSLKTLSGERNDLSNAANQVLLSLGFTEDEITVQVAGNDPKLLVDWFCLQRALLIQAMARAELRSKVVEMWQLPFGDTDAQDSMKLIRQLSVQSNISSGSGDDRSVDSQEPLILGLFENFTNDRDSAASRDSVLRQYRDVYECDNARRGMATSRVAGLDQGVLQGGSNEDASLLSPHVFPLNDSSVEKDWVLSHRSTMDSAADADGEGCSGEVMPKRIEKLLDCCFPSKLLRNDVVPFDDLRPQSSFNFRALMMPQRRYFSFRREGQLLARLCEKQAAVLDTDEVHWTIGFTNSTFAGEFVESLVQTLYLCPMITGLSFARNSEWLLMRDADADSDSDEGGGLLANLAGSLPPWVSYLTFDNILNDRDFRALVAILDAMGKLSSDGEETDMTQSSIPSAGQSQGKFNCVSIRNSPQISRESWNSFYKMLGKSGPSKRLPVLMPLSSLKVLDLSGNKLGDEAAALVLELVHDKDSGCSLEQLDLSGNRIGRGTNVVRVLRSYTEYYRYNQKLGVKMIRSSWKSTLHTLVLAENDLFLGQAGLEIFALLKHNALCLRYLDLSNNGLEGDTYQLLASSLLKNTSLCHLNLSGNKFSSPLIDLILEPINDVDAESGLSFLLLENNTPPLNGNQWHLLKKFLRKSRKNAIERFVKETERSLLGDSIDIADDSESKGGELDLIDETSSHLFRSSFRTHQNLRSSSGTSDDGVTGDNMITVLFSAPLVFADEQNRLHPFAKLDFDMERELLWQCMKEASRDIEVSFDNAHHSRLLATLTKRCSCLHYSGHGHPNFLPFEDGMGGPNWFSVQDIKELIVRDGAVPFKFVFVSACHSGLAGETFASAGVPHVVCCRQESELKDTAALAFTRSFYLALAVGQTVKESFAQGCKAVRATPNLKDPEKEMEKFVLLPKDGNHDVPVFRAKLVREWPKQPRNQQLVSSRSKRRGSLMRMRSIQALGAKSSELSTRNMMQEDPSPTAPQFFIGREVDMYYILTALLKMRKRLVSVLGETGIGRSSLLCSLCHYINERASTITEIQRIYFIKPKHGGRNVSCRSLLRQLLDKLEEDGKCRPTDEEADTESMLDIISRCLKNDKALIVFDRTELLEKSDESQELPMILSTLLYDTKQVKVVLTGRNPLGQPSIGGQVEHPFNLGPLNFANSVRLFANLCPHLHTPSERGLFFTELVNECKEHSDCYPQDAIMNERSRSIFSMVGDGVPAKIEKAAYSISKEDLRKLREGTP